MLIMTGFKIYDDQPKVLGNHRSVGKGLCQKKRERMHEEIITTSVKVFGVCTTAKVYHPFWELKWAKIRHVAHASSFAHYPRT